MVGAVEQLRPLANAGGPYSGTAGTPISVDGSSSQDPTGRITMYAWDFGDGTSTTAAASATATHIYSTSGTFTVTLTVTDNADASSAATTTASIGASLGANYPPVAKDDSATVGRFRQSVIIPVLQNDSDVDGDPLTILDVGKPSHGSVTISDDTLVYTSSNRYFGQATFTYTISDGRGGTASATVFVTVTN